MDTKPLQIYKDNDDGKLYLIGEEVGTHKQWIFELHSGLLYTDPRTDENFLEHFTLVGELKWNYLTN